MGRYFLEHLGGRRIFSCENCKAFLTNEDELISRHFTGSTGPAFLFDRVVNVEYSETQMRTMITGRHIVRDVMCKRCKAKLGWMYEYAMNEPQKYKEAKVILEKALIEMSDGIDNPVEEFSTRNVAGNVGNEESNGQRNFHLRQAEEAGEFFVKVGAEIFDRR
ncbi:Protein yippee-like 5 [Toxocara canis]|uniref:Protein yippee-like n=1 Tax=Toxocara canis TaxID=6265 RepID=A0A0B2VMA7_TOXCA|nr:Protein yippee-like 5 [Toxocara canis]